MYISDSPRETPYGAMQNEGAPQKETTNRQGLSLCVAAIFIVGEMAGSGVLALPRALADSGWSGIALMILCCLVSLYSGICLGRSWSILEERYEEYRERNRFPYPAIAQRAYGMKMRYFVSFCIDFNLFGVGVVFLLLSSQLISSLAAPWGIPFCHWILIMSLPLAILMWLETPKDFWPAALIALATTVISCVLLLVLVAKEIPGRSTPQYTPPTLTSFFLSYGTMMFAFGGAAAFPTFQNDMRDKSQFSTAATMGFVILLAMYLPVAILGYFTYGSGISSNIFDSIPDTTTKSAIALLLAIHMFFAFLLVINVPAQDLEEFLQVPRSFGWRRCALRSSLMLLVVFVAQSIPRFLKVLNLVGGSLTTLTSVIFPCLFYLRLCAQEDPKWTERPVPLIEKTLLVIFIICGVIGGGISTYSAIGDIVQPNSFNPPCYINITAAGNVEL